jgi:hypothetical protein
LESRFSNGENAMKKDKKKTIMIIALVSVFLCGCPGCYWLVEGLFSIYEVLNNIQGFEGPRTFLFEFLTQSGWKILLGGVLIIVPVILVIITLVTRSKKEELEELEPTGASKNDPLPPTS